MFQPSGGPDEIFAEYLLPLEDDLLETFLNDPRIKACGNKTNCNIEVTKRILNRKINGFKWVKYSILRISGPDEGAIRQCNKLLERACPLYKKRKDYSRRAPVVFYTTEFTPDNIDLYYPRQRTGRTVSVCGDIQVTSPYDINDSSQFRELADSPWKVGKNEQSGIYLPKVHGNEKQFEHYKQMGDLMYGGAQNNATKEVYEAKELFSRGTSEAEESFSHKLDTRGYCDARDASMKSGEMGHYEDHGRSVTKYMKNVGFGSVGEIEEYILQDDGHGNLPSGILRDSCNQTSFTQYCPLHSEEPVPMPLNKSNIASNNSFEVPSQQRYGHALGRFGGDNTEATACFDSPVTRQRGIVCEKGEQQCSSATEYVYINSAHSDNTKYSYSLPPDPAVQPVQHDKHYDNPAFGFYNDNAAKSFHEDVPVLPAYQAANICGGDGQQVPAALAYNMNVVNDANEAPLPYGSVDTQGQPVIVTESYSTNNVYPYNNPIMDHLKSGASNKEFNIRNRIPGQHSDPVILMFDGPEIIMTGNTALSLKPNDAGKINLDLNSSNYRLSISGDHPTAQQPYQMMSLDPNEVQVII